MNLNLKNFNEVYLNILNEENNLLRYNLDYLVFDDIITEETLINGFKSIINESDNPNYYVKLPNELSDLTKKSNNKIIDKYDILSLFPEFEEYNFPKIFVSFFDFSNKNDIKNLLKSISKIKNDKINFILDTAFRNGKKRGMFIELTKFGINFSLLFFNIKTYNERTIYHEWTHIFQTYVGNDFEKIIELSEENKIKKNYELKKFNLTFDIVQNYFFSKKEYVTRLDNLIYMIHQVQKLNKYKKLSDIEFFTFFKIELCKKDLNVELIGDILNIDKNFLVDIQFFIASYICFDGEIFTKLCFDLQQRI